MKKIIALAVAAAFVAPVAMAEVTVYGSARTSVEYAKVDGPAADYSKVRLVDQSSRLGFKGSDKLDNGLTVLWQAEQRVRVGASNPDGTNNSASGWGDRDTFVGLQGDFGMVRAGKFDDIIDQSRGDFFSALGGLEETGHSSGKIVRRGAGKSSNTIAYYSPSFGGFGFKAQGVMGNDNATGNANGYAATAFYKSKMVEVGAGYKAMNDIAAKEIGSTTTTITPGGEYEYMVVGASVMPISGLKISAAWDRTDSKASASANSVKQDGYGMGATYTTGKYAFNGNIAKLNDRKDGGSKVANTGAWEASLSMNYMLSKQTKLTAGATYVKNDSAQNLQTNTASYDATMGAKLTSVSVGIHTNF